MKWIVAAAAAGVTVSCVLALPRSNVVELVAETENLSQFAIAVRRAGLVDFLRGEGPFTVFAPTNEAFERLGEEEREKLFSDPGELNFFLMEHIALGRLNASDADVASSVYSGNGTQLTIRTKRGAWTVAGVPVIRPDLNAENGVVHLIDGFVVPPGSDRT